MNNLHKRSIIYMISSLLVQLAGFISVILMMKTLSLKDFGIYSYCLTIATVIGFVADGGMLQYNIKEIIKNKDGNDYYMMSQKRQLYISVILFFIILIISMMLPNHKYSILFVILSLGLVLIGYMSPVNALMIAKGEVKYILYRDAIQSFSRVFFVGIGCIISMDVYYFAFVNVISFFSIFMVVLKFKNLRYKYIFSTSNIKYRAKDLLIITSPFLLLMVLNYMANRIDVLMLEYFHGAESVAIYNGASQFIYPLLFISAAISASYTPKLAAILNDKIKFIILLNKMVKVLILTSIIVVFIAYMLSPILYHYILPNEYFESMKYFKILIFYILFVFTYTAYNSVLIMIDKVRVLLCLNFFVLFINAILNFIFIPSYGIEGAALTTLASEIILVLIIIPYTMYIYRGIKS